MIAFVDRHVFKLHGTMFFLMMFYAFMAGALNAGYRDAVARQAETAILAQIPDSTYTQLPIELLLKVPVQ